MPFYEIILLAIGLSMDSMAVSATGGALIHKCAPSHIFKIASVMAFAQAGMTVLGFLMGRGFSRYIAAFDHWIAFLLLAYIGGKMIYESLKKEDSKPICLCDNKVLFTLSMATSIDALAIGVTLALLHTSILIEASLIGIVTFVLSAIGVYAGSCLRQKLPVRLDLIGGCILVLLGIKILITHLFFS